MLFYNQSVEIRLAHRLYTDFQYFSLIVASCIYALFVAKSTSVLVSLSLLSTERRGSAMYYQCARIGRGCGGGIKPILAMPGFRKRLSCPPLKTSIETKHFPRVPPLSATEKIICFVTGGLLESIQVGNGLKCVVMR